MAIHRSDPSQGEARVVNKISIYQGATEYPTLHICVSDNPRYWEDRLIVSTVEDAVAKIEQWLRKKMTDDSAKSQK